MEEGSGHFLSSPLTEQLSTPRPVQNHSVLLNSISAFTWSVDQVCEWLLSRGLSSLQNVFKANEVDGSTLLHLTKEDIRDELNVSNLASRKKLWDELEKLKNQADVQDMKVAVEVQEKEVDVAKREFSFTGVLEFVTNELASMKITIEDHLTALSIDDACQTSVSKDKEEAKKAVDYYKELRERERSNLIYTNEVKMSIGQPILPVPEEVIEDPNEPDSSDEDEEFETPMKDGKREVGDDPIKMKKSVQKKLGMTMGECVCCLEEKKVIRLHCDHLHCIFCLRKLFLKATKDLSLMPPRCCKIDIDPNLCNIILEPKDADEFKFKLIEATTENKLYCPKESCSKLFLLDYVDSDTILCDCGTFICTLCKQKAHYGTNCEDNKMRNTTEDDKLLKELSTNNHWRQCEKCKQMVELSTGCYHMTCICKHEFCYECGATWTPPKCINGCKLWEDERLTREVELREPVPERRQQLREVLQREGCGNEHNWSQVHNRRYQRMNCMHCGFDMKLYHYRCDDCRFRACYTCRFHRMVY